jgi:hypothetical protein
MARPPNWVTAFNDAAGWLPSLREHWREINRQERAAEAAKRAARKASDKKRQKCRCAAYPWPHRPRGGLCRWPDAPLECYQRKPRRPYRKRYQGLLRQVARANRLHPIRDRKKIEELMPRVLAQARLLKRHCPKLKYRNMLITATGVTGQWQTAGPMM